MHICLLFMQDYILKVLKSGGFIVFCFQKYTSYKINAYLCGQTELDKSVYLRLKLRENFYEKKIDAVNDLPDDRHWSGKRASKESYRYGYF